MKKKAQKASKKRKPTLSLDKLLKTFSSPNGREDKNMNCTMTKMLDEAVRSAAEQAEETGKTVELEVMCKLQVMVHPKEVNMVPAWAPTLVTLGRYTLRAREKEPSARGR
jgi:hypothetical protein